MKEIQATIDSAINEIERLRTVIKRGHTRQVTSDDERAVAKTVSLTWFKEYQPSIRKALNRPSLEVDAKYTALLTMSDRASLRSKYILILKQARADLIETRPLLLVARADSHSEAGSSPDFSTLVHDATMQKILVDRWNECASCVSAGAPLAGTVMMGGLLEALLLARVHRQSDKIPIFSAKSAPKDPKTSKTLQLKDWGLKDFIDIAHELKWISESAKDISIVLRDYRNFIHPYKQLSHSVEINTADAELFWEIAKRIAIQLL